MLETRGRLAAVIAVAALTLSACGGSDEPSSSATDDTAGPTNADPTPTDDGIDNACTPDVAATLLDILDPEQCWSVPGASQPVLIDDTVFAVVVDPMAAQTGEEMPPTITAYDAADGSVLWTSDPLPGELHGIRAAETDGEPAIAALVTENDEGDAVTEESQAWGYLAWPADVDEDTPTEAPVHITAPVNTDVTAGTSVRWTDQGVLAGDQLLKPGATEFEQVVVDVEPVVIGDYDLDETFVGLSGDTFLSYATGVAYTEDGGEDGDTYRGWVARGPDGSQSWDTLVGTPNTDDSLFGEGPSVMPLVIGEYALTVTPTDETYTAYELKWLDAAGNAAAPKPADLAGAQARGGSAAVMTSDVAALLTPNAKYLFVFWSTLSLVIDVEAGTVAWVDSDFEITGDAIDDSTVYGRTENGTVTIDLATATATAQKEGTTPLLELTDGYAALTVTDPNGNLPDQLVIAARR